MTRDDLRQLDVYLDEVALHWPEIEKLDERSPLRRALDNALDQWTLIARPTTESQQPAGVALEPVEAFAAVDEPGAEPLAQATAGGAAIANGSLVLVYGTGGAGKTTLVLDLCFALANGDDWLGILEPVRPLRVTVIENEGPRPMFRQKLRDKLAATPGFAGSILVQTEPWARFTFESQELRASLAEAITAARTDLLVVGPLSRVGMKGGGTLDQIADFEKLMNGVRDLVDHPFAVLLVHHENRAGQISGAWEGVPDTLVHVQGQGHGRTRVHWQKARWSSELHGTTTQLVWAPGETFTVEEKPEITDETIATGIIAAVRDNPGASWSKVRDSDHVTGNATQCATVRDRLLELGQIVNTATREGYFNLVLPDTPEDTRSQLGTGLERLTFPIPAGADEPSRSPVPDVSRNGERNGTAEPGYAAYLESIASVDLDEEYA